MRHGLYRGCSTCIASIRLVHDILHRSLSLRAHVQDPRVYISRGDANSLLGQSKEALDNYRHAVSLSPMVPEVGHTRTRLFTGTEIW